MSDNQVDPEEFKEALAAFDKRLRQLEAKVFGGEESRPANKNVEAASHHQTLSKPIKVINDRPKKQIERQEASSGSLLGVIGVCCLILAMILLIKFSIDSGWLTPVRQLYIAGMFGFTLVVLPMLISSKDRSYISLLPAGGVAILHLTTYGAVLKHQLMSPVTGLGVISAVGVLSLFLLNKYHEDIYAILAIGGTYIGSLLLKSSFASSSYFAYFLFVWDIVFVWFAILLKNRKIVSLTAYFGLGVVGLLSLFSTGDGIGGQQSYWELAAIQIIQMLLFSIGTLVYSVRNNTPLEEEESWQLFPVYLFFYGQVYYFLDQLEESYAITFSFSWGIFILLCLWIANSSVKKSKIESKSAIFAYVTILFVHAGYFVLLNDFQKCIAGLLVIVVGALISSFGKKYLTATRNLLLVPVGYTLLMIIFKINDLSDDQVKLFGFIYGIVFLVGRFLTKNDLLLLPANVLIVISISRTFHEAAIAPICIGYAFTSLIISKLLEDKVLAKTSLPVIILALIQFTLVYFKHLSQGESIIALVVMGALIYSAGFLYRKVVETK